MSPVIQPHMANSQFPPTMSPVPPIPGSMVNAPAVAPTGTIVSPASPVQGHISSPSVQSLDGAMLAMGHNSPPAGGAMTQTNLERVISPFVSSSSMSVGRKVGDMNNSSHDFSNEGFPMAPSPTTGTSSVPLTRNRMNPPAYTAAPGSDEVRTMAVIPSDVQKHEYRTVIDFSGLGLSLEENDANGTGVGTGVATFGSPLERGPPSVMWGGSTVAGSSKPAETVFGEDVDDAHKQY